MNSCDSEQGPVWKDLRGIFETENNEETGGWRILYELHNLCFSPNIIRMITQMNEINRPCSTMGN
jgi:hypothetical protein